LLQTKYGLFVIPFLFLAYIFLKLFMNQLHNYAYGQWIAGADKGQELFNAITGDVYATTSSKGLDFAKMCEYARNVGGPKLRKLTFQERGLMLKALALHLQDKKEDFIN
jgi:oxepin-CoA hydrolase/3-oxo-5,6-dehydrosuberyl-CoA semialdehyde dehydrogenase